MAQNAMRRWLEAATRDDLDKLAKLAKTTVGTIRQLSGAYRTGGVPSATPELARRLDIASQKMARADLPPIAREELCPACSECEYAKSCGRKSNASPHI